jgi:hypothetical protein
MKKKYFFFKAMDAYSIGMLVRQIWKEEWNKELLFNPMRFIGFDLKLKGLKDIDPETRLSILDVLMQLKSHLYSLRVPDSCFRSAI